MRAGWPVAVLIAWLAVPAAAHDFRPAYLGITAQSDGALSVAWSVPTTPAPLAWPARCAVVTEATRASAATHRTLLSARCTGGEPIVVGLPPLDTDLVIRVEYADGTYETELRPVASGSVSLSIGRDGRRQASPAAGGSVAGAYLKLGLEHILLGWDHLVFVLLVYLAAARQRAGSVRRVLSAITGFTIGHSVTLGAAALGAARLPSGPVEASIALSLVYVAREVMLGAREPRAPGRTGLGLTSAFGLLHGFGFAGALAEIGLPDAGVATALLAFNAGVECGQVAFVSSLMLATAPLSHAPAAVQRGVWAVLAVLGGGVGVYWLVERTVGL